MKIIKDLFCSPPAKSGLGLCLSGGGALGFAHIGVLQSLEDHGIYPTHIAAPVWGPLSEQCMLPGIRLPKCFK